MASSSTADPASSVPDAVTRAPFDPNVAEVVLNKELFESQGIDIVDFTRRFLSVKETRGIAVDRQGVETYWSMGVKLAYEHAHYKRSSLVAEVTSDADKDFWHQWNHPPMNLAPKQQEIWDKRMAITRTLLDFQGQKDIPIDLTDHPYLRCAKVAIFYTTPQPSRLSTIRKIFLRSPA